MRLGLVDGYAHRMNGVSWACLVPIVGIVSQGHAVPAWVSSTSPHTLTRSIHCQQREPLLQSLAQGESINEKKSLRQADQQKLRQ